MKHNTEIPEIVRCALVETVTNIGQLTPLEQRTLDAYVKRGWLSKGKGGPYPILKIVYAHPGYDFALWRERYVKHAMALADLDRLAQEQRNAR
jgi:hypothetical protein